MTQVENHLCVLRGAWWLQGDEGLLRAQINGLGLAGSGGILRVMSV